jgi:hypothetical protein
VSSFKKLDEKIIQLRTAGCKGEGIRKERWKVNSYGSTVVMVVL